MGVLNGEGHLAGDADCLAHGELGFAFEAGAKGSAGNEGHDVIQQGVMRGSGVGGSGTRGEGDGAAVENRQDVRVREARGEVDLPDESLGADDGIEVEAQDLEGDGAVVLEVVGQKDSCHAALTEFAVEAVAVTEGCGKKGGWVGHGQKNSAAASRQGATSRKGERTQEFPSIAFRVRSTIRSGWPLPSAFTSRPFLRQRVHRRPRRRCSMRYRVSVV